MGPPGASRTRKIRTDEPPQAPGTRKTRADASFKASEASGLRCSGRGPTRYLRLVRSWTPPETHKHEKYVQMSLPEKSPKRSVTSCSVEEDRNTRHLPTSEALLKLLHVCLPPPIHHPPPIRRAIARMRRKARKSHSPGRSTDIHMHGRK